MNHMPAPSLSGFGVAPAHCYRVLMRDANGGIWTPIIVAGSQHEAEERAVTLMGHRIMHSVALHPADSDHTEVAVSLPDRRRAGGQTWTAA